MTDITRRTLLALSGVGLGAAALGLTGCTRTSTSTSAAQATGDIAWWDHFQTLSPALESVFDTYRDGKVTHTVYSPDELGPALQLAKSSNQLPDVFTNLFGLTEQALVDENVVAPLKLSDATRDLASDGAFPGIHTFNGEIYSLPIFTNRQHASLTWFDRRQVEAAGGDPDTDSFTWDEFRRIIRTSTSDQRWGWVTNLAFPLRLEAQVMDLAQGAGQDLTFATNVTSLPMNADPATGEYRFDSPAFLNALEFLRSIVVDGGMFPSSTSLNAVDARARWAAGSATFFFDGPWNAGILKNQFADFLPSVGVSDVPTPDGVARVPKGPSAAQFWMSKASTEADGVGAVMDRLLDKDFAVVIAENMDQPPLDVSAVERADVAPVYARAVSLMQRSVTFAPSPVAKNTATATVVSHMNEVRPTLGEIAQGYLAGEFDDVHAKLTTLTSQLTAERDRALKVVKDSGVDVDVDDWRFSDYSREKDYDADKY